MLIFGTKREPVQDRIFYGFVAIILSFVFIICLYPILYIASSSFSDPTAVSTGKVRLFPVGFSLAGYQAVFKNPNIVSGYYNSFVYALLGTLVNLFFTLTAAFSLSRRELVGRNLFSLFFAFTMWFSGGMIPSYLLMRDLGLLNTRWVMILPGAVGAWNVILTRTFFQSNIPEELFESASLDGCGYFRYFAKITLPLSGAIVAVIALFCAVGHWNAYFGAFLYLTKRDLFPLQIILREILIQNKVDANMVVDDTQAANIDLYELLKYSLIMVACVPLWLLYPFVQKSFVKGVMIGSIKG